MRAITVIVFAIAVSMASATVYNRCSLAKLLHSHGVTNMNTLANYVCTAQYESSFNDRAVGALNKDGTQDFGIFQINNKWWCKGSVASHNGCNIACSSLLGNVPASLKCAEIVLKQQGWKAWYGWQKGCAHGAPSVASCF